MYLIQPCCTPLHLRMLRDAISKGGTAQFQGYGDMSLTELLPALLIRYSETEMMIVAPSIPDQAADIIGTWMRRQWAMRTGTGKLDVISHLTVMADLSEEKSPVASQWLKENPWGDRLTLVDKAQEDTAILLPDIAITGPLNLRYGRNFVCDVTTVPEQVRNLWERYIAAAKEKPARQEAKPVRKSAKKRKPSSAGKTKQ
jgi:hypothetical protein